MQRASHKGRRPFFWGEGDPIADICQLEAELELIRVPRVPGTRGIFGQYCPAPADFGNFTT